MYELTELDPMIDQPNGLYIKLKQHQRTLVHRCIMLEQGKSLNPAYTIHTKLGIICDKVGSGKSYTILSILLLNNDIAIYNESSHINTFASVLVPESYGDIKSFKTNILVVPSPVIQQWVSYLENTTLKYVHIYNQKSLDEYFATVDDILPDGSNSTDHVDRLHNTDVILIGSKIYSTWYKIASQFGYEEYLFRRMIIDETVHISLPDNKAINAKFYWFITASWETTSVNIKNRGFIKKLWYFHCIEKYAIFMKNNDKFVDLSMGLFESNITIIESKTTKMEQVLIGFVQSSIIKIITATTEQYASAQYIAEHPDADIDTILPDGTASSGDIHSKVAMSIINTIAADMYNKLHNLKIKLNALNDMQLSVNQKELRKDKLNNKIQILKERIQQLKTRISECNIDPVTMEDIDNPVVTECCKQLFNESTIEELYKLNPNVQCPMCRQPLTVIKVVESIPILPAIPSSHLTRLENFKNVVSTIYAKSGLNTKLLIFSEYNKTFELIDEVLSQFPMIYTKYISDAKLLERYKTRNINILLLNALSHSAGLNLENTTDIIIYHEMTSDMETQIIGRANRLGRIIGPLNVWKFV